MILLMYPDRCGGDGMMNEEGKECSGVKNIGLLRRVTEKGLLMNL